jgi:sortase A
VLLGIGLWQLGLGLWIPIKAEIAQLLLARAWAQTLDGARHVKPWPWADTWPVARLHGRSLDHDLYVLADDSGRSLAFGPGLVASTSAPGIAETSVIAGHRDTHFRFLRDLKLGDALELETADGDRRVYRMTSFDIVDAQAGLFLKGDAPALTLVTCYPFDAIIPGGPLRYVVTAEADAAPAATRMH